MFCLFPDGVQLSTLFDMGSMQYIISADPYQQIADRCSFQVKTLTPLKSICSQQSMPVTGQPFIFLGLMATIFALSGCDYSYNVEFMV